MTYQQTVLNDKPAGFWMITAASGTSETDLSGNSKTATITEATDLIDRGYRPLVTGTSTDRAYRFYSGNHKLTYPTLEIWDKGRNHIPFSVEFTVQPITSRRRVDLFAPQEASNASVPDNGIFLENGRLYFSVSNGSASSVPTVKSVASTWLSTGATYHVVAVYSASHIALYVDGVLAADEPVDPAITWSHTTANFITTAYSLSSDTTSSSFLFDALSVYRAELSPKSINNHYVMSTPNITDVELVNSLGGKIIKLNDEDRTKAFEYSAKERGWSSNLNVITGLVQNDDGSIGLKKIKPLKMYNTAYNYNNILTSQQANCSGDWIMQGPQGTITTTTAQASTGTNSMEYVSNGTTTGASMSPGFYGLVTFPNAGGKIFTHSVWVKAEQAARFAQVTIAGYDGVWVGQPSNSSVSSSYVALSTSTWTQISVTTAALPAKTGSLGISVNYSTNTVTLLTNGEKGWIDQATLHEGSSPTYRAPNTGPTFAANADISTSPRNVLVWGGATAEEAYSGMVVSNTNQSLARVSTDFYSGSNSWQLTSTGAGASVMSVTHSNFPVEPGKTYTSMFKVKPTVTARNVQQYVNWYDSSSTLLGNSGPVSTATTLNTWSTLRKVIVAPPKAVRADFYMQTVTNMVTGDIFYLDEIGLIEGDVTQWVAPTFNNGPYEFSSKEFKYASLENVGEILGADQGAIGVFAMFTTASNDDVQEQVILSVASSSQNHILEVVKKADKNLYIRYIYKNTSGVITTTETSWGAISSLLGGLPYIYLEWGGGLASLYVNATSSPAQIAFDAGIPSPRFDANSYMNIGAGYDGTRPWNNYFRTTKVYDKAQPAEGFTWNKTAIEGTVIKFEGNLNVSQTGSIVVQAPTGTDGTTVITQTTATWEPLTQNTTVKTSPTGVVNMLTSSQATMEDVASGLSSSRGTIARYFAPPTPSQGSAHLGHTVTDASSAGYVYTTSTGTSAMPCKAGATYTVVATTQRGGAVPTSTRLAYTGVYWYDSAGTYISNPAGTGTEIGLYGVPVQHTASFVAPSNAAYVQAFLYFGTGRLVGETFYMDAFGIWEGTSTTWTEPLQTVTYGSEIVPNAFPGILPGAYYTKAFLSTDDSYYAPTKLNTIKLEAFANNQETAENAWDEAVSATRPRIYSDNSPEVRQHLYEGEYVNSVASGLYLLPVNDTATTATPDGGSSASTAGPAALIRTLEFWVYPETQGYHAYYDGATEYSMRYYDSGGFTTTGFTTLYVDGASVTNGTTSTTWYNRWHHIVLTNASAQININTAAAAPVNLLTANQSTGGDTLSSTAGIQNHTGATMTYDTAQQLSGAGSIKSATITPNRHSLSTTPYPAPVIPGKTYTARYSVRAGASPTGGFAWTIYIEWHDLNNVAIVSTSGGSNTTVTQDVWTTVSLTAVAPEGAHYAVIIPYRSAAAGGTTEDAWIDNWGLFEGSSGTWASAGTKMRVGGIPVGGTQTTSRYQNISYYPQTFDAGMVTTNYKAYLGDMTGGSVSDSGSRSVSDSVNLVTSNQATVETDATGFSVYANSTISRSTAQSLSGAASLAVTSTAALDAVATTEAVTRIPVTAGKTYTAIGSAKSSIAGRSCRVTITWYRSIGTSISQSVVSAISINTTGWTKVPITVVAPTESVTATLQFYTYTPVGAGEVTYWDEVGIWEGAGVEWAPPVLTIPNPKTFNDIWTTETIKVR